MTRFGTRRAEIERTRCFPETSTPGQRSDRGAGMRVALEGPGPARPHRGYRGFIVTRRGRVRVLVGARTGTATASDMASDKASDTASDTRGCFCAAGVFRPLGRPAQCFGFTTCLCFTGPVSEAGAHRMAERGSRAARLKPEGDAGVGARRRRTQNNARTHAALTNTTHAQSLTRTHTNAHVGSRTRRRPCLAPGASGFFGGKLSENYDPAIECEPPHPTHTLAHSHINSLTRTRVTVRMRSEQTL